MADHCLHLLSSACRLEVFVGQFLCTGHQKPALQYMNNVINFLFYSCPMDLIYGMNLHRAEWRPQPEGLWAWKPGCVC